MSTGFDSEVLLTLALYTLRLIPLVFICSLIVNLLVDLGFTKKIGRIFSPFLRLAKLPGDLSVVPVITIFEAKVGHAMMASLLKKQVIDERHVIACVFLVTPLVMIYFTLRLYLPVAFPALGVEAATIYIAFSFAAAFVKMIVGIFYGRMAPHTLQTGKLSIEASNPKKNTTKGELLRKSLRESLKLTKSVALRTIAVVLALALLYFLGIFKWLNNVIQGLAYSLGLSSYSAAVVAAQAISPMAGLILAGTFLSHAQLTVKEAIVSLMIGKMIFLLTADYPRHAFPFYASLYPTRLAFKMVAYSTLITVPTLAMLTVLAAVFL